MKSLLAVVLTVLAVHPAFAQAVSPLEGHWKCTTTPESLDVRVTGDEVSVTHPTRTGKVKAAAGQLIDPDTAVVHLKDGDMTLHWTGSGLLVQTPAGTATFSR